MIAEEVATVMGPTVQAEVLQIDEAVTDLMVFWSAPELYDVGDLEEATINYLGYIHGRALQLTTRMEDRIADDLEKLGVSVDDDTTWPEIDNDYILELNEAQLFNLGLIPGTLDFVPPEEAASFSDKTTAQLRREFGRTVVVFRDSQGKIIQVGRTFGFTDRLQAELKAKGILPEPTIESARSIRLERQKDALEPEKFVESFKRKSLLAARDQVDAEMEAMVLMSMAVTRIKKGPFINLTVAQQQAAARQLEGGLGATARNSVARTIYDGTTKSLKPFVDKAILEGQLKTASRRNMYWSMKSLLAKARNAKDADQIHTVIREAGEAYLQGQITTRHLAVISNHIGGALVKAAGPGRLSIRGAISRIFAELSLDPTKTRAWYLTVSKPTGPIPSVFRAQIARESAGFRATSRALRSNLARLTQEVERLEIQAFGAKKVFNPTVSSNFRNLVTKITKLEREVFANPTREKWAELNKLVKEVETIGEQAVVNAFRPFVGKVPARQLAEIRSTIQVAINRNITQMRRFGDEIAATIKTTAPRKLTQLESALPEEVAAAQELNIRKLSIDQQWKLHVAELRGRIVTPARGAATTTGSGANAADTMGRVLVESIPAGPPGMRLFAMESALNRMADRAERTSKILDDILGIGRAPGRGERALEKQFTEMGEMLAQLEKNPASGSAFEALAAKTRQLNIKIARFESNVIDQAPRLRVQTANTAAAMRADGAEIQAIINNSVNTALTRHTPGVVNATDMQKLLKAVQLQNEIMATNLKITRIEGEIAKGTITEARGLKLLNTELSGLIPKMKAAGGWRRVAASALNGPFVLYKGYKASFPLLIAGFAIQQTAEFFIWGPAIYGELSGIDVLGYGGVGTKRIRTFVNGLITTDQSVRTAISARAWDLAEINLRFYSLQLDFLAVLINQNREALLATNNLAEAQRLLINHRNATLAYEARIETGRADSAAREGKEDARAERPASDPQRSYIQRLVKDGRVQLTSEEQKKFDAKTLNVKEASEIIDRKTEPFGDNGLGQPAVPPIWLELETPLSQEVRQFQDRDQPVGGKVPTGPAPTGLTGVRAIT